MLMVTPCTDWYLVFTGVAKGNVPLSTSILPINLILQIILLPIFLLLFFGRSGNVEFRSLVESILLVLLIPFLLVLVTKKIVSRSNTSGTSFTGFFVKSQVLFLSLAVVAMFASEGRNLLENPDVIYKLLFPVIIFFIITFLLAQLVSRFFKFSYQNRVSLTLTTMARNSPISLAIAVSAFAYEPLVALSLVIGPLIELPILALTSQLLLKIRKKVI